MRYLYSIVFYLGIPFILLHFVIRGMKDRRYLARWKERFGWYGTPSQEPGIVVHAASVGELNAAMPLIRALLDKPGSGPLTVTSFTPTGSAQVQSLLNMRVSHIYAPLDLPGAVKRFYRFTRPRLLIVMETEIWPNLFHRANLQNIPVLMANARLSTGSLKGYQRFASLARNALSGVSHIAAQSASDAGRLIECGAPQQRTHMAGNLKFDISVPQGLADQAASLRNRWGADRPVLIAASTHLDDDVAVLTAMRTLLKDFPGLLLILVPRHPERFEAATELAIQAGLVTERFSDNKTCSPRANCFVIDAMGELMNYYACSDVALVGGSFGPVGGHNMLEASALGLPVITGPNVANFAEITDALFNAGAAVQVKDAQELARAVKDLLLDTEKRKAMGSSGLQLVRQGKGALRHTLEVVDELLSDPVRS